MKKILVALLLTICFSIHTHEFFHQKIVYQGHPVTFVITPEHGSYDYTFTLLTLKGKKVLDVKGFNYFMHENKTQLILGLGGIPCSLKPGKYKVKVEGKGAANSYYFERFIIVKDRKYPSTEIKANAKMDQIINGKIGPERIAQSKRWWKAVRTFNPYANYHEGKLIEPVRNGYHSSPYGLKRTFIYPGGKRKTTYHRGEDYAIKKGAPIYSDSPGRVILAEDRIVTGKTVMVEHLPGVISMYYHMSKISVSKDDIVKVWDKIGEVGSTGFSTGPHLHWEVRFSTIPVDAKYFLGKPLIDKSLIMNMINNTK